MSDINGKNIVMGFQHTFVMFGATVLVPLITGLSIGVTLFAAGIGTLLFHFLTKRKVPVFLGSSFAFIPPIMAVTAAQGREFALGGVVIAGLLYLIASLVFYYVRRDVLHRIFAPQVTGPIIILIGLILAPVAIQNANGTNSPHVAEMIGKAGCWGVAIFTFAAGVFVKVAFERFGWKFFSTLPVLIALVLGYLLSAAIGIIDFSSIREASVLGLPDFTLPRFSAYAISMTVPVAIVTMIEHFGDILAIGNVVRKDFLDDPGIHRTLLGDGLATSLSALIGGPANTTYSENTGAVALTGNFNPIVMRIAAIFAVGLSLIPKFTAAVGTIPVPVIGGISILLFGMISAIGIKNMVDARLDLTDPKMLIIVAVMLVLGLGGAAFEVGKFALSGLGLAAVVGIILNAILNARAFKQA
jgi:uracil permease